MKKVGDQVIIRRVGWFIGASGPDDDRRSGDIPGVVMAIHDSGKLLVEPDFRPAWVVMSRPGQPWAELFMPEEVI